MEPSDTALLARLSEQAFSVLLVEDDELLRARLELLLSDTGYGVLSVGSCREAREAAAALVFPLIIIDRTLGDGDGIELIAEMRKTYTGNSVYMMLLTARDSADEVAQGLAAGADTYLSKRSPDAEILRHLKTALKTIKLTV